MNEKLPALLDRHVVSESLWQELSDEIIRVTNLINSGAELSPEDFTHVRNLNKRVDEFGKEYNRTITAIGSAYKRMLTDKKAELGYGVIEDYIARKRQEQVAQTNERQRIKLDFFNQLLEAALVEHPLINQTGLRETVLNNFISRFPKVNSGAQGSDIKNWQPIATVIKTTLDNVETKLEENPSILQLPIYSESMKTLSAYLRTGDAHHLSQLEEKLMIDRKMLEDSLIRQQLTDESVAVNMLQNILNAESDDKTKLQAVTRIITLWNTK